MLGTFVVGVWSCPLSGCALAECVELLVRRVVQLLRGVPHNRSVPEAQGLDPVLCIPQPAHAIIWDLASSHVVLLGHEDINSSDVHLVPWRAAR